MRLLLHDWLVSEDRRRVLADYGQMADLYADDAAVDPIKVSYDRPTILGMAGEVRGKRVLDVGCASGGLSDLTERIAGMLRVAAEVLPADSDVALAAGLGPTDQIVEGRVSDLGRRNQASLGSGIGRQALARAEPEDSVPAATLGSASEEIGQELAARVLRQFRVDRR